MTAQGVAIVPNENLFEDAVRAASGGGTFSGPTAVYNSRGLVVALIGQDSGNGNSAGSTKIDEVAIYPSNLGAPASIPASPYAGSEGMTALYHTDNDLLDSAA